MRPLTITIACAVLTACASAPARRSTFAESAQGRYSLIARANNVTLRGKMEVLEDTVLLDLERTVCRRDVQTLSNIVMAYKCDPVDGLTGIAVSIDRRDPSRASTWRTVVQRQMFERRCMGVSIVNGREVCVRYENVASNIKAVVEPGDLIFAREVVSK